MKRYVIESTANGKEEKQPTWQSLGLASFWLDLINILAPDTRPRSAQSAAFQDFRIHESRRNLIVSAPTNGGKSLVGLIPLFQAIKQGRRAILIEPLRAIAQEKLSELQLMAPQLSALMGFPVKIGISTGDYRLNDEEFCAPPSAEGELIIATPERLEAIMRNPAHADWIESIGAICVDEAHLLTSLHRGPTLDFLITSFLCLPAPPRIVLLSATVGNTEKAERWLAPCDTIRVTHRYPPLTKEVVQLEPTDDLTESLTVLARQCLSHAENNLLIFVYQTRSAEKLASILKTQLGSQSGQEGALPYHAQMNLAQRTTVQEAFRHGRTRCVVSTTALGQGVNLPATHVILRDTTFPGAGTLDVSDILQMLGRAGRGNQPGHGMVIVRPSDKWTVQELSVGLEHEVMADFDSPYVRTGSLPILSVATNVGSYLARNEEKGLSEAQVRRFFALSFGGHDLESDVPAALTWLSDPTRVLAYRDEFDLYRPTVLGTKATYGVLPLDIASGFAQLIRDILLVDPSDGLLQKWQPLDHLIALTLLYDRSPSLRRYSKNLVEQVDVWVEEDASHASLLFREWIRGQLGFSQAESILGSLHLNSPKSADRSSWAHRTAFLAVFHAVILWELGQGRGIEALSRRWSVKMLDGIEERWRDDYLWLLSGLAQILDLRCFFYHLKEECGADAERIRRVKRILRTMRHQVYDLQEQLKFCSPLGPMLRSIRRTRSSLSGSTVGTGTIRKLEQAGIKTMSELITLSPGDLVKLGIRQDFARQIHQYVQMRLQ